MHQGYPIDGGAANGNASVARHARVPLTLAGQRCDVAAATMWPEFSRARLQRWLENGELRCDGRRMRPRDRVNGGERFELEATLPASGDWQPQPLALEVVHQDADLMVVEKPAGLVVHPGAGNPDHTLVNALLHHDPALAPVPRAGIVHRLDKDTSGLLAVARTLRAHVALVAALKRREVRREYLALVRGRPSPRDGEVDQPIGRDPRRRTRMAVTAGGRPALTRYRTTAAGPDAARLWLRIETGRTHQIRVHLAHLGHPVLGDATYGGRPSAGSRLAALLAECSPRLTRQALHAARLTLAHPVDGRRLAFTSAPPDDIEAAARRLGLAP